MISFRYNANRPYNGLINVVAEYKPVTVWDDSKSLYDMMDEFKPEVLVYKKADFNLDKKRFKKEFKNTKLVVLRDEFPSVAATLFNISPIYIEEYQSDVLIVGETYENLYAFLPLINSDLKIKIIGRQAYPTPLYVGNTSNYSSINFIDNAKIVVVFTEQGQYNVAVRGKYVVVPTEDGKEFTISCIYGQKFTNLLEHCQFILADTTNSKLPQCIDEAKKFTSSNTYYHRAAHFFDQISESDLVIKALEDAKTRNLC